MVKAEESQPHHHHHVRIKINCPTPINKNKKKKKNVQQPCHYLCGFCNKSFASVYALNGHTRMHSSSHSDNNNNNNNVVKTYDGTNTFPSDKSLFSHTTVTREITPCRNIWSGCRFNIAAAYGGDDTFCHSSSASEHSDDYLSDGSVFRSWPLSCKRSRKPRLSPRLRRRRGSSCSEVEVDPLMQEAAYTLMLLANGVLHSSTPGGENFSNLWHSRSAL